MRHHFAVLDQRLYERDRVISEWVNDPPRSLWRPSSEGASYEPRHSRDQLLAGSPSIECRLLDHSAVGDTLHLTFAPARRRSEKAAPRFSGEGAARAIGDVTSDAVGVCTTLCTVDGYLVIQERHLTHVRYPGWYHVCGGILEAVQHADGFSVDPFQWMASELAEELSIEGDHIERMICLGLVADQLTNRPELVFATTTYLPGLRFRDLAGPEHSRLLLVEDASTALAKFLLERESALVPSGLACLMLYGRARYGEDWHDVVRSRSERRHSSPDADAASD